MENENFVAAGATGLAMEVGRQRSEIDRLRDDKDRDIATLRTEIAELRTERETKERLIFDVVTKLRESLDEVTTTIKSPGPAKQKPTAADDEDFASLPTRIAGERTADYYKRVSTWASDNDEEQPPKPPTGPTANGRSYADKVARFYEAE